MKCLFFLSVILFLNSCSSQADNKNNATPSKSFQKEDAKSDSKSEKSYKSQVTIEDEDGKKQKKDWVKIGAGSRPGKYLQEKSVKELVALSKTASSYEVTLIIDELLVRKESSIPALATFLQDKRYAAFQRGREYWWYGQEKKSPEPVTIGIYAAYAIQKKTSVKPQGVFLNLTKDRMFYGIRGEFAVVKEDVIKVWEKWWSLAKNDY